MTPSSLRLQILDANQLNIYRTGIFELFHEDSSPQGWRTADTEMA